MDNAKKLLLVDPSRAAQLYRPTTTDKKLSSLDREIEAALNSSLPDDEKAKRYLTVLKDYRKYEQPTPAPDSKDEDVLKEVPEIYRPIAKRLLKHIKPHITWSDAGEIIHKQSLVPDSNISELLSDAVEEKTATKKEKPKTEDRPVAWEEFATTLNRARTPKHLIRNKQLWSYLKPRSRATYAKRGWIHY